MKTFILCTFLFAAALGLPKGQTELQYKRVYIDPIVNELPKDLIPRITNGREATPHSIPYQAYLIVTGRNGQRWLCGGSLISDRNVLTAAHCLDDGVSASVSLGAHNVQEYESTRVVVESRNLIPHENYNADRISDDIGIIVLDEAVELNYFVGVVALPSRAGHPNYEGADARISGWGRTGGDLPTSPVLQEVNTTVISNALCRQIYDIVIDSQLCTSGYGGVGSCSGDSGGPLVAENTLIGVVSYGVRGCLSGYPSGFSRVTSYLNWIEEKTCCA